MDKAEHSGAPARFPDQFLEDVKARVPLSTFLGRKLTFDARKSQPHKGIHWACCPFHAEKTPSFRIDDDRGRYHCFGCGKDGDHFTWLMEREGQGFPEAVAIVAQEAGLPLPTMSPEQHQHAKRRATTFEINAAAQAFFAAQLAGEQGQGARAYLEGRGVPSSQWQAFGIGYAPAARSGLYKHLATLKFAEDDIIEAGLAKDPVGSNLPADRFTGRIMFPIRDRQGRVVGFGGRATSTDQVPKFLNTAETSVFSKGRILWNLDRANDAARDANDLILVEGYLDVTAVERAGLLQVASPMGTAITPDQLDLAWRAADEPCLCLDGDKAGAEAMQRALETALPKLKPGKSLSFATMPKGMDPDELLNERGAEALIQTLKARRSLSDVLWDNLTGAADVATPERQARLQKAIVETVARIADPGVRKAYENDFSQRLKAFWKAKGLKGSAPPFEKGSKSAPPLSGGEKEQGDETGKGKRPPRQTDNLIGMVEEGGTELFIDLDGEPHATIGVNRHHETWPIRSKEFRRWLAGLYYLRTNGAVGGQAMEDAMRVLEAKAATSGIKHQIFRRIGQAAGNIYVDICDDRWRSIEITSSGWRVVERAACKFIRGPAMRPLCDPEAGGMIEELGSFINFRSDSDFHLIVGWIVGAFRPIGPYAILMFIDEQGTGKSFTCRLIQSLIDPNGSPLRTLPDNERDIFISAWNRWTSIYDNLSSIQDSLSDALCRMASGGGTTYRALYSDREEAFIELTRPIVLNGIADLSQRPDLSSRSQRVSLRVIPETERRTEADLWAEIDEARPRMLGAILDAVVCSLKNFDSVKMERMPRMADYVRWVTAAEPALGWEPGTFLKAFEASAAELNELNADDDLVVTALRRFFSLRGGSIFEGTMADLLEALNEITDERTRKSLRWPANPTKLGNKIRRMGPTLRTQGYNVDYYRSGKRMVKIEPAPGGIIAEDGVEAHP